MRLFARNVAQFRAMSAIRNHIALHRSLSLKIRIRSPYRSRSISGSYRSYFALKLAVRISFDS